MRKRITVLVCLSVSHSVTQQKEDFEMEASRRLKQASNVALDHLSPF